MDDDDNDDNNSDNMNDGVLQSGECCYKVKSLQTTTMA